MSKAREDRIDQIRIKAQDVRATIVDQYITIARDLNPTVARPTWRDYADNAFRIDLTNGIIQKRIVNIRSEAKREAETPIPTPTETMAQ